MEKTSDTASGLRVLVCRSHQSKSPYMVRSYTLNCAEDSPSHGVPANTADFQFKSDIDVSSIDNPGGTVCLVENTYPNNIFGTGHDGHVSLLNARTVNNSYFQYEKQ